jgi:hypothetical protein
VVGRPARNLGLFSLIDCQVVWVRLPAGAGPVTGIAVGAGVTHADGLQCRDVNADRRLDLVMRNATSDDGLTWQWQEIALRQEGEMLTSLIDGESSWFRTGTFTSPEDDTRLRAFADLTCPQRTGGLRLLPDGLDLVDVGDPSEQALTTLIDELGVPDEDSGITDFPGCPGTAVRSVRWSSVRAWFTDGSRYRADGVPHLFAYDASLQPGDGDTWLLTTPEGIGVSSTITDLQTAFGTRLSISQDGPQGPSFVVSGGTGSWPAYVGFLADGDPQVVTWIGAGQVCGE